MKTKSGFTLIELMVVVAVISVLAAIAIPNYSQYVLRSRITGATSTLSDMRVRLEQFFQDNRTYVGACAAGTVAPLPPATADFAFTCPVLTATTFTVRATGATSMANFIYEVTQGGRNTVSLGAGWTGAPNANCWVTIKGGGC